MDFGAKVSQPGFDVETAADFQLLLNSSWPILKIDYSASFSIDVSQDRVLYTHNLGYVPMFIVFRADSGAYGITGQSSSLEANTVGADETEIKFFGNGGSTSFSDYRLYVYRLPISTDFLAPSLDLEPSQQSQPSENYGMKISKVGKSIDSTDLRDYVIHSSAISPTIHQVGFGVTNEPAEFFGVGAFQFAVQHNLGYIPLVFFYVNSGTNNPPTDGYYILQIADYGGASLTRAFVTTTEARFEEAYGLISGSDDVQVGIVILQQPFNPISPNIKSYNVSY